MVTMAVLFITECTFTSPRRQDLQRIGEGRPDLNVCESTSAVISAGELGNLSWWPKSIAECK